MYNPTPARDRIDVGMASKIAAALNAMAAAATTGGRRALLAWYIREVQRREPPQSDHERIVTYPLA
jgi:hypothetical protein